MHAIKGGWVGQTFALAQCNDSGAKKSRIRRSKEERKAMVESFIKKYQKLNSGNFPSLNLTHKEVGGSFYTVREIVREVIQENRVLGPAKLTSEGQSAETFLEQYPLGSLSMEPESDFSSSSQSHILTHILPNQHQDTSEELVLNSGMQFAEPEHHRFDEEKIINGSGQAVEKNDENDKMTHTESPAIPCLVLEKNVAELEASKAEVIPVATDLIIEKGSSQAVEKNDENDKVTHAESPNDENDKMTHTESPAIPCLELEENVAELEASKAEAIPVAADLMVETFPLISGSRVTYGLDEISSEPCELTGTLMEKEIGNLKSAAGNSSAMVDGMNFLKSSSDVGNEKAVVNLAGPLLEKSCGLVDERPLGSLEAPLLENASESTTKEVTIFDTNDGTDPEVKGASPAGVMAVDAPANIDTKSIDGTIKSNSGEQSISTKAIASENKPNLQHGGSYPTLDRVNIKSWETTTKRSAKPETNPLPVFFRALIAALVKFFS